MTTHAVGDGQEVAIVGQNNRQNRVLVEFSPAGDRLGDDLK